MPPAETLQSRQLHQEFSAGEPRCLIALIQSLPILLDLLPYPFGLVCRAYPSVDGAKQSLDLLHQRHCLSQANPLFKVLSQQLALMSMTNSRAVKVVGTPCAVVERTWQRKKIPSLPDNGPQAYPLGLIDLLD